MAANDPRKVFSAALLELGEKFPQMLAVSCDSAAGSGMGDFLKKYPDRIVEVGISEQNAISLCAGLAFEGFIPVVSAIAPFISMRCYEQIRNDVGYVDMNVKIIGSSSGLSHSQLGSSHQANEDMALMRTIPHMAVLNPGDAFEVEMALKKAVEHQGPVYIRMPRHPMEDIAPAQGRSFEIGKAEVLSEGEIMLIATGTMTAEAKKAAAMLSEQGIGAGLINVHTVRPLDAKTIIAFAKKSRLMVTVEEHSVLGGLGSAVAECISAETDTAPLFRIGIQEGAFNTGPYRELLADYGLTSEKIADTVQKLCK